MANDQPANTSPAQQPQPTAPTQPATPVQQPTQQADPGQGGQPFVHPSLGNLMIKGTEPAPTIRATDGHVKHG